jgi:hypothetical protein
MLCFEIFGKSISKKYLLLVFILLSGKINADVVTQYMVLTYSYYDASNNLISASTNSNAPTYLKPGYKIRIKLSSSYKQNMCTYCNPSLYTI